MVHTAENRLLYFAPEKLTSDASAPLSAEGASAERSDMRDIYAETQDQMRQLNERNLEGYASALQPVTSFFDGMLKKLPDGRGEKNDLKDVIPALRAEGVDIPKASVLLLLLALLRALRGLSPGGSLTANLGDMSEKEQEKAADAVQSMQNTTAILTNTSDTTEEWIDENGRKFTRSTHANRDKAAEYALSEESPDAQTAREARLDAELQGTTYAALRQEKMKAMRESRSPIRDEADADVRPNMVRVEMLDAERDLKMLDAMFAGRTAVAKELTAYLQTEVPKMKGKLLTTLSEEPSRYDYRFLADEQGRNRANTVLSFTEDEVSMSLQEQYTKEKPQTITDAQGRIWELREDPLPKGGATLQRW